MTLDKKYSEWLSDWKTPEKNKNLSSNYVADKKEILSESQILNNKLLEELRQDAKNLKSKIESTWKVDNEKRKERWNFDIQSLWWNKFVFESHWISTEFENVHHDKAIQTLPSWEYSNEAILKSWDVTLKVKIFWDHTKFVDLLSKINY
jgi:hypothetical protein